MFEKINYIALAALIVALIIMIQGYGRARWKDAEHKDFYAMAANTNVSDLEKKARIKEKYGDIEKLIDGDSVNGESIAGESIAGESIAGESIAGESIEKAMQQLLQMENPENGNDAHLYFLKGRIYSHMKLHKESIRSFLKAVKYDPDYVDEGCALYKGTIIKEATLDALEYYKDKSDKDALKLVYSMQRRLAGSCE